MARLRAPIARALAVHQSTVAAVVAVTELLRAYAPATAACHHQSEQRALAARLHATAARLTPGWLGVPVDAPVAPAPPGGITLPPFARSLPTFLRIGHAQPVDDVLFPVVVPLLSVGHLAIDADARDRRVADLLRAVLLRLIAASPPGSVQVRVVDCADTGVGNQARDLPGVPPPATDQPGLRSLLAEAERWVADSGNTAPSYLVLIVASLPELTSGADLARLSALATAGPAARVHIVAAGWPPPPLTAETTQQPLPHCTQVSLRNPHAWIGDPPGATYDPATNHRSRLPAPAFLDPAPPAGLVQRVREGLPPLALSPAGPDPGGQPDPGAWPEYVAAVQRLTASQRAAAALVAEHERMRTSLLEQLAALTARLHAQANRLLEVVRDAGAAPPQLAPAPAQVTAVRDGMAAAGSDPITTATATVTRAIAAVEAVDAAMTEASAVTTGSVIRDVAVYGFFTTLVALLQLPIVLMATRWSAVLLLGVPCALALSGVGFFLGWVSIGVLNGSKSMGRSATAGMIVSVGGTFPLLAAIAVTAFG